MQTIEFQNKEFKIREVYLHEFGNVIVSTISLNRQLLNKVGNYVSDEARFVDEQLFFFVEESEIDLPEYKLIDIITEQVT